MNHNPVRVYTTPVLAWILEGFGAVVMLLTGASMLFALVHYIQTPEQDRAALALALVIPGGAFMSGLLVFGVGQVINLVGKTAHHAGVIADSVLLIEERGMDTGKLLSSMNTHTRRTSEALAGAVVTHGTP